MFMKGRTKVKETLHPTSAPKDRQICFSPRACWGGVGVQVAVVRPVTAWRTTTASSPGMIKAWEWVWLSESLTCTQMFTLCQTTNRFQRSVSHNTTQRLYLGTSGTQKTSTTPRSDEDNHVQVSFSTCSNRCFLHWHVSGTVSYIEWSV